MQGRQKLNAKIILPWIHTLYPHHRLPRSLSHSANQDQWFHIYKNSSEIIIHTGEHRYRTKRILKTPYPPVFIWTCSNSGVCSLRSNFELENCKTPPLRVIQRPFFNSLFMKPMLYNTQIKENNIRRSKQLLYISSTPCTLYILLHKHDIIFTVLYFPVSLTWIRRGVARLCGIQKSSPGSQVK